MCGKYHKCVTKSCRFFSRVDKKALVLTAHIVSELSFPGRLLLSLPVFRPLRPLFQTSVDCLISETTTLARIHHGLRPSAQPQTTENIGQVIFHRSLADHQGISHFP